MRIVFIGLSLSSSWGNGHATTYRALLRGLASFGHELHFFERDQPWYAANRDLPAPDFCELSFYKDLEDLARSREVIRRADVVVLGSYTSDGVATALWLRHVVSSGLLCFYDIDTPVTLQKLTAGEDDYLSRETIPLFDIYFSFSGGPILNALERFFGAQHAVPLHCGVDTDIYRPVAVEKLWDLGYIGTYSADRQPALERLLLEPARQAPHLRFVVAGPQYPDAILWPNNVERVEHLPPEEHPRFYSAQRWTLNITRADMVAAGYSPSVRLFEASACATPIISDPWPGIESFFPPGEAIYLADGAEAVLNALNQPESARQAVALRAQALCLDNHTARHRAGAFIESVVAARAGAHPKGAVA